MRAKHRIFARGQFFKRCAVLLLRLFFAGEVNRGIRPRQARPHDRPVFKLSHGVDGQVGSDFFIRKSLICLLSLIKHLGP
jgi:hypothetical protein